MTLKNVPGVVPGEPAGDVYEEAKRAVVFVLNEDFLHAFKVMCASLVATGSFLDLPVIVITDQAVVRDHPFVQAVADKVILAVDADMDFVQDINSERVPEKFRYGDLPKYTFLKWLIFGIRDYDELIYFDSDMVCLRQLDRLDFFAEPMGNRDLFGCPVFRPDMYTWYKTDTAKFVSEFEGAMNSDLDLSKRRFNSGVMRIGGRLLSDQFFDDLMAFAAKKPLKNEQSYLTEFFRSTDDYQFGMWGAGYNAHARNFSLLPVETQLRLLDQVSVFHYIGDRKPWLEPQDSPATLPIWIWREFEKLLG